MIGVQTMKIPTDRQILETIYSLYHEDYKKLTESSRSSKMYIPIDCQLIANKLEVDKDIIFGRLYYHFEKKYAYKQEDNSKVHFFAMYVNGDSHCLNFPLMTAVLASLQEKRIEFSISTIIAGIALVIAIIALFT